MSSVVYVGSQAGLIAMPGQEKTKGGDQNSPFDYVVICTCGQNVGPLGRFVPNKDGLRTPFCVCDRMIVLDRNGQVLMEKVLSKAEIDKLFSRGAP